MKTVLASWERARTPTRMETIMGWIGPTERIQDCLKTHADRDEEGDYLVRGAQIASFLGAGEEYVLGDDTEICIQGEWKPIIPLLQGGMCVTVI
jgi:hypothetical protein